MKKRKFPLLLQIVIAIAAGALCGIFFPDWLSKIFATFNGLFGNFLGFIIPFIIVGLVAPGIAEMGNKAGRLLLLTTLLAYLFTIMSGLFSYGVCQAALPALLGNIDTANLSSAGETLPPYFSVEIPPVIGVMSALVLSFVLGIGMSSIKGNTLRNAMNEFRDIISLVIAKAIVPLLPLYIFGIFLSISRSGQFAPIFGVFLKVIALIFAISVAVLLIQFIIAGGIARRNPLTMLRNMLAAYATALGTQSSAATIPVTLEQTIKNGVRHQVADFVVPLCATIHLSGSTLKIVGCAIAIMMMNGTDYGFGMIFGFICMLGITMIAAPGVPGGAIMAALPVLQNMLGFSPEALGLMTALYIAMDSFGTATNVTGDGAVALIVDTIDKQKSEK
ncbi:MAG: dicarboxylate/amino acid:cation symporter [Bacteroidaceae bacterium]|nr:dicarboxylate/amino acid:cation symporter [Bacteroidaceae bacterium]